MKFKLNAKVTFSAYTEVEAESLEEAFKIAKDREVADFHIDGTYPIDENWLFDNDGIPDGIYADFDLG